MFFQHAITPQFKRIAMRSELIKSAAHFPLLDDRAARRQAKKLVRAKLFVSSLPVRKWVPGPTILGQSVMHDAYEMTDAQDWLGTPGAFKQ